jgi:hypothetical protein
MLAANLAADLLADAEIDTMRFRLYHLPARLTKHARHRWLRIEATCPWADAFNRLLAATL